MRAGAKAGALKAWTKSRAACLAAAGWAVALGLATPQMAAAQSLHHPHPAPRHFSHHLYAARHSAWRHDSSHPSYAYREASPHHYAYTGHHDAADHARPRLAHYYVHHHYSAARYSYSRLQCVPYAREVSHIQLSGDAFLWWAEAAGRYARGNAPVEGAVLNFRSIPRMPLGHVAVVTAVLDSRTILVTQANWVRGTITNDVTVQDVSPDNDWSEVEVELGDSSRWGAAYPTYGFIYNQPADSTVIAGTAPSEEVAEAPRPAPIAADAPDRNLQ